LCCRNRHSRERGMSHVHDSTTGIDRFANRGTSAGWRVCLGCCIGLVLALVSRVTSAAQPPPADGPAPGLPYPPSPRIQKVTWAPPETIRRAARDSDNWPTTWADDDHLYTAYGDGTGFAPKLPMKLSLGLARIEGGPESFQGVNLRAPTVEARGDGKTGWK